MIENKKSKNTEDFMEIGEGIIQ